MIDRVSLIFKEELILRVNIDKYVQYFEILTNEYSGQIEGLGKIAL